MLFRVLLFYKYMQGILELSKISLVIVDAIVFDKSTCYEPLGFIEFVEKFGELFSHVKHVVCVCNDIATQKHSDTDLTTLLT